MLEEKVEEMLKEKIEEIKEKKLDLGKLRSIESLAKRYGILFEDLTLLTEYLSLEQIDKLLEVVEKSAGERKSEAYAALPEAAGALKLDPEKVAEQLGWLAETSKEKTVFAYKEIVRNKNLPALLKLIGIQKVK